MVMSDKTNGKVNGNHDAAAELDELDEIELEGEEIPDIVICRLPTYARSLAYMLQNGITTVSSSELAAQIGGTAAQIRRDLSYFGEFGKQGKGYNVEYLLKQIKEILNIDRGWNVALVGTGNLGQALVHYHGFRDRGFHVVAAFDRDPHKFSNKLAGVEVYGMDRLAAVIQEQEIAVGIIAVPPDSAQDVADRLVAAGVKAILNYADITVQVPDGVRVRHIDPISSLQSMTYYLGPAKTKAKVRR